MAQRRAMMGACRVPPLIPRAEGREKWDLYDHPPQISSGARPDAALPVHLRLRRSRPWRLSKLTSTARRYCGKTARRRGTEDVSFSPPSKA